MELLQTPTPAQAAVSHNCPVCNGETAMYDVVDFNKCCGQAWGQHLPLVGRPIYYRRCKGCAFTYAPEFAAWSDDDFVNDIYNDSYINVDPEYVSVRPVRNAQFVYGMFNDQKHRVRHLDYGGGNGLLSEALAQQGWESSSYDPFPSNDMAVDQLGKFNFITAFEVFEHVPDIDRLMANLTTLMTDECLVLFSTALSDGHLVENGRLNWWYASPRNGHISLFSKESLRHLAQKHGLQFGSFNDGVHCFFNKMPAWAEKREA